MLAAGFSINKLEITVQKIKIKVKIIFKKHSVIRSQYLFLKKPNFMIVIHVVPKSSRYNMLNWRGF